MIRSKLLPFLLNSPYLADRCRALGDVPEPFPAFFSFLSFLLNVGFITLLPIALSPCIALADNAQAPRYAEELVNRALNAKLFEDRYWHLLLHYRPNTFYGVTSEVDDPRFFLADSGKTNPKAELIATIRHFFSPRPVGKSQQTAQCAFIARYQWLKEKLRFEEDKLQTLTCQRFQTWITEINSQAISLIFTSAYINNPASMFGHTFLRIDQKGQTEQTRILAYTINYAADVPPNAGMEFAYKGIFGGYQGLFSSPPYYLKVKEYRDIENRDMWEYRLNFTKEQVDKLLLHTWELGDVYFDYFFFKENCAYHILALLEIADPTLHLTDQFILWTVPADTIRLISQQPNLVQDVTYRPSHNTQIKRKREKIPSNQLRTLNDLVNNPSNVNQPPFKDFEAPEKRFLLDLAVDYLQYKQATEKDNYKQLQKTTKALLLTRSKLGGKPLLFRIRPYTSPPETGHDTSRASVGLGWRQDEMFEEISLRAGYHDLLDPDAGYLPNTQLILASGTLRHYEKRNQYRLENFTLANIVSIVPMDTLFQTPSWKFNIGMETIRFKKCKLCSSGNMNVGFGAAAEAQLLQKEVYFLFAEFDANVSGAFDEHYRIGGGVTGGAVFTLTEKWKALASVSYLGYPLGHVSDDIRFSFRQRYTLSQNWALRGEFSHRDKDNQATFLVQTFF